jgi:hypothetical protein
MLNANSTTSQMAKNTKLIWLSTNINKVPQINYAEEERFQNTNKHTFRRS